MSPVNTFLDPLLFDLPTSSGSATVDHTKLLEELDLWTNAQFTFDMQPGTAVQDKPTTTTPSLPLENEHDLWKFLSLDPTQQQQQQSPTSSSTSSSTSSPAITSTMPVLQPSPRARASMATHPKILPKSVPQKRDRTEEEKNIEEDKRRRNTAASARFRAKKKLREQAMEQAVKEMSEKSEKLEERVKDLEHEIKWLRSLLIDKDTSSPISSSSPSL
ncbi:hypothetical protein K492DRAFT_236466 [Lichtheimia hyalospora FSU 10163]|nr:hypothetical protein K492DRAFT_236466 [Lichtheimia hyalospora FSU 10163]